MDTREFINRYARSPLGIGALLLALGAAAIAAVLGAPPPVYLSLALALIFSSFVAALVTGLGPGAAVREGEREAREKARSRMAKAGEARKRLAALRLPEGPVARARDLLVLEAGRLIETFEGSGAWDPEAAQAVVDSLDLVDAWQREADEAATERRFSLPDRNPFPEAAERTASALRDKAALISSHRAAAAGELPPVDRVAIEEELK